MTPQEKAKQIVEASWGRSQLCIDHDVLVAKIAEALEQASPAWREWKYCPECGSDNNRRDASLCKTHRQCEDCKQEWFTDIDYSSCIKKFLKERSQNGTRKLSDEDEKFLKEVENFYLLVEHVDHKDEMKLGQPMVKRLVSIARGTNK